MASLAQAEPWIEGTVVDVRAEEAVLVLDHRGVSGLDAGRDAFACDAATLAFVEIGQPVRGQVEPSGEHWQLRLLWPSDRDTWRSFNRAAVALEKQSVKPLVTTGARLPEFAVLNAEGRVVHSREWHGQRTVLFLTDLNPESIEAQPTLRALMSALAEAPDIFWVGFSLFPESDAPATLELRQAQWRAATGAEVSLHLARSMDAEVLREHFAVAAIAGSETPPRYVPSVLILDREGGLRFRFEGAQWPQVEARSFLTDARFATSSRNR